METMQATGNNIIIKVNGTTICYDDLGRGSLPIIFIHGFPFNKSSWQPQMDFFKSTQRVIAYDIRGFGKSTYGNEKLSINLLADDLIKLMDGLEISKAIVCGLSMGGYILLNAVDRYPERIKAIILCDTQCIADTPEVRDKRNQTISHIIASGLNDFTEGFIKNIFCDKSLESKIEAVEEIKQIILSTRTETITVTLGALMQRNEMCTSLSSISVPALILCGKEDKVTPPVEAEFLHNKIKNSSLQIIDNAGHMSNLEQADVFNSYLDNFISDLRMSND